jgi:O-antigen ligase
MIVAAILLISIAYLLRYRLRDRFVRAYALFFGILLFFVLNKGQLNEVESLSGDATSPLSLLRWLLLGVLLLTALRVKRPQSLRPDVPLVATIDLFLVDVLLSTTYSVDAGYSFLRALSFVLMAAAVLVGGSYSLYWRANCLQFFRFHYFIAWSILPSAMFFHLTGLHRLGATVLMGQYAGPFSNQNLFGIFSALVVPYVLFHWRREASSRRVWWADFGLLMVLVIGLWLSNSRGGMLACVIAVTTYFFVVSLEGRLKIVSIAACLIVVLAVFPRLQQNVVGFIRKDTVERAEIRDVKSQFYEERRYSLWAGVFPLYWKEKVTGYGFATSHLLAFPFSGDKEAGRHVHNSYLELFGDLGLPGIVLLLLILGRVAWKAAELTQRRGNYLQRDINAVFISVLAAGVVNAFFESWMFSVGNIISLMFWMPVAGVVAQWQWRNVETPLFIAGEGWSFA